MDKMLTLGESAPIARCSPAKMYRLARSGELPFLKVGSTWMISESKLCEALGLKPTAAGAEKGR
ncbi:helix-turn-helix domain-containing protein [Collinsella tanakaei]|uniref:helix-turn-helix domain-containing protein n=1 Tax=Collinsella tanakaei TaxID=626935 RepID=UPI00195ED2C5|nr:helix-turn-helix domain-containing protein [Collinsella tanakaei]MBM6778750.1 helix-turn-helix domain-containing protein [Collinsella tanakaei]